MDMKRILQAMDSVATTPVVGAEGMAKFLRIVKEADLNQLHVSSRDVNESRAIVTEGKTQHKVALPIQMAMQHYQQVDETIKTPSLLKKYFVEAEAEIVKEKEQRRALINQYASIIAERVQLKNRSGN